jgi:hypothetical protein
MKNTQQGNKRRKERIEVQTKDHTRKCKTYNGEPEEEKTRNLGPNPMTSSTKQVVQGDVKILKGHQA